MSTRTDAMTANTRRDLLKGAASLAASAAIGGCVASGVPRILGDGSTPRLVGPIEGGRHNRPFASYYGDISRRGYVEEEYFLEGTASAFQLVGGAPIDGRYELSTIGSLPYRTRILVRRPRDPKKFNGTVIVEWINVSAGFEIACVDPEGLYDGFAWVSISAQRVGVHGYPLVPTPLVPPEKGLRQWDPERYGSLTIPGDSLSYDIFTQGARAIGPSRTGPIDPMGGLHVRKLIAAGASQSGFRLLSYINGVQPRENLFDAFLPLVFAGRSASWKDLPPNDLAALSGPQARVRDDLSAKVLALNSETEAGAYLAVRQPDTDTFRYWEVAGASHGGTEQHERIKQITDRDGVTNPDNSPPIHISDVLWVPTADAAIRHLHRWINGGTPPPVQKKIEFDTSLVPPIIARDKFGNAVGGVRLPDLTVPIAQYLGKTAKSPWLGETIPFSTEMLRELYPTHDAYVRRVSAAAQAAASAGVILPYRVEQYVAEAHAAAIPG